MTYINLPEGYDTATMLESDALSASPIACAVADAWAQYGNRPPSVTFDSPLWSAIDALEAATRASPLRKVRP